ncbi:MAG: 3-phosphoserine/phosphohydroxythreonine transaminase [Bacteroidia bacterium]|nr:3-phosphoserine/phosphohydroxythreonine transaminase [Bacteroidia bacterium]
MKKLNFFAGPAILPDSVLDQAAKSIENFDNMGLSLIEISHRSKEFVKVMDDARQLTKDILDLNDNYEVLFLQGGASSQFYFVPYNFIRIDNSAAYLDTGTWASNAIKEARFFGNVNVVGSSKDKNYSYIPKDYSVGKENTYLHLTSNNTIYGTTIYDYPSVSMPTIVDMSSDIFSRELDYNQFDLIYAGAQKNLGPAGATLVIINKDLLNLQKDNVPTMIDYNTHINKASMFNTPPVFAVYVCYLTLKWIKENGGLSGMEKRNRTKADLLYNEIDRNSLFEGVANKEDRSLMNVTFTLKNNKLEEDFLKSCADQQILGIKGHRSVGGFRASIYNAMKLSSVETLVHTMKELENKFATVEQ